MPRRHDWRQGPAVAYARADKLLSKQKGAAAKAVPPEDFPWSSSSASICTWRTTSRRPSVYGETTGLRPKDAQSYFDMASVAINAGRHHTALLAFTKFLELDPDVT